MTEKELMDIVDAEIAKSENCIETMKNSSSWMEKGKFGQKSVESLHFAVAAMRTLIKGAISAS
jgi:hypothetical protein